VNSIGLLALRPDLRGGHNRWRSWDRKRLVRRSGRGWWSSRCDGVVESSFDESGTGGWVREVLWWLVEQLSILQVDEFLQCGLDTESRSGCGGIGVLDEVKEVFGSFFEEMFEAVSYVIATVIVLAAFELKEGLESGGTAYGGAVSLMKGNSSNREMRKHGGSGFEEEACSNVRT